MIQAIEKRLIESAKSKRCPVCGAAYGGPRRSKEYQALVEAGLVTNAD